MSDKWIKTEDKLPVFDDIVWCHNVAKGTTWIGGRTTELEFGEWCWGNTYGSIWHNGERWTGELEIDSDYTPTHWKPLPKLPEERK